MVKVVDGICDMPDICKNEHCTYFDMSRKATKQYLKALSELAALPPMERKQKHTVIEFNCPFLAWKDSHRKKQERKVYK